MLHLLSIVWSLFNTVLRGYLIKVFWAWFIVTQFPSLPTISILPALGFSFFVSAVSPWKSMTAKDWEEAQDQSAEDRLKLGLVNSGVYTLAVGISLGMGWVVHHFM